MRPTWLIEAGVYGDEAAPLLAEIRRQGMACEMLPHQLVRKGAAPSVGGRRLADDACVVGYGTWPFARQIQLHHDWIPGAWCSPDDLDCATYYAHFRRYLLNQDHAILPGVEAIRQRDGLYARFGKEDEVFARPTSCHKLFVGRRIHRDAFASALAPTRYDVTSSVVIAAPREIGGEWRVVVIGDRVIAGSQYAQSGQRAIAPDCPPVVRAFAEAMLTDVRWRPDPIFMMDIGESDGRLWLVELNSFSCSWLYQCDLSEVIAQASELASQEWERARPGLAPSEVCGIA